ncbi:translation initiation factor IF-3 [Spirulina subsalsa]|uniref:translation initiation factor IF-3 n=1 Tax=Spirulina subsalsa TaxID=54311 RepID=UPI000306F5CE|nr:translation initiation factor IF-3 [Spirulina subsalsa]
MAPAHFLNHLAVKRPKCYNNLAEFKEKLIVKKQPINQQIKAPQVLLIDHENNNLGLTDTAKALQMAKDVKLDLVMVSSGKDAPVAKILDYGKFCYQQKKRQGTSAKSVLKEVKLRPNVGESDYGVRIRRAEEWLSKGDSVRFQVRLRGREHQHRDRANELLQRIINDLGQIAKVQSFDQRALMLQVVPA